MLTGCISPQDFTAKVNIKENKDVEFLYKGTVIDHHVFSSIKSQKMNSSDTEDHERKIFKLVNKKDEALKQYDHLANGVFMADYAKTESIIKYQKHQMIKISNNKDGSFTLTMPMQSAKTLNIYADANLEIDGNLEVNLPKSVKVISHNADDTPGAFGGAYKWKYTLKTKQSPSITFSFD